MTEKGDKRLIYAMKVIQRAQTTAYIMKKHTKYYIRNM